MVYRYRFYAACAALMLLLLSAPSGLRAQSWQWANAGSGSQNDLVGGVGVDSVGNTYVVGTFENNIAFGSTIFTNGFNTGLFIVKYNPAGAQQWALQGIGAGNFINPAIAVSRSGELVVTGGFNGTVRIGTDTLRSSGGYDMFAARFSNAGTRRWIRSDGMGADNVYGRGVAVDPNLNAYITGFFADTARFDTFTVKSKALNDIFLAKYDQNGILKWVSRAGGTQNDEAYGIGIDAGGSSYITGRFSDSSFFGIDTMVSAGSFDPFVAKFSDIGNPTWATPMGGRFNDAAQGIAVDQFGNSLITGTFSDTASFGDSDLVSAGSTDIFVAKVDGVGAVRWAVRAGGPLVDAGYATTVDALGTVYVTGYFADSATFGNVVIDDSTGTREIFVAAYDGAGAFQWVRSAGGPGRDEGRAIAIDRGNELRVAGEFTGNVRIGPRTLTPGGLLDVFTAKLGADPTISIGNVIERTFCPNDQFSIPFSTKGVFETNNFFTAQLSDSSGSFNAPIEIGKVFGFGSGSIQAKIPDTVIAGEHYRVRIVSSSPVATSNLNEFPLIVYALPHPVITPGGPLTICKGETVTLDAGAGFGSYLWITGETTRMIIVNRTGEFTVRVSNDRGCSSTSAPVKVTQITAAKPVISRNGSTLESTPAAAYQWSFKGAPINGSTGQTLSASQEGAYTVQITDSNGCTATSEPFNYTLAGVPEELAAGALAIYPHPNTGLFTVSVRLPHASPVKLTVLDARGRVVRSVEERSGGIDYSRRVDIESEPAGVYFVRIESDGRQWVREMVKR